MTLGERLYIILKENNIKQIEFAKTLGISANYVNLLLSNKRGPISESLANLIQERYGYSSQWLLEGTGEKFITNDNNNQLKYEILKKINYMSLEEIKATLAFVKTLEFINIKFKNINNNDE